MSAVKIVKALLSLDIEQHIDRVKIASALQSLRQIFFFPSELIFTLELASTGSQIEEDVLAYYAEEFSMVPSSIQQAFDFMDHSRFESAELLTTREMSMMTDIRYGKLNLRRDIHQFFAAYQAQQSQGSDLNKLSQEASRILGQIARFNASVQELESKFISVRGRSIPQRPSSTGVDDQPPRRPAKGRRSRSAEE
ncbi:hypothetical protein [Methylorubrum extorquens]